MLSLCSNSLLSFNAPVGVRMPAATTASAVKMAFVDGLEGVGEETGSEIWDPIGIADSVSDEAVMWFRAAELKHGRVAMLASVGYLVTAAGFTFPGTIGGGVPFAEIGAAGPYDA